MILSITLTFRATSLVHSALYASDLEHFKYGIGFGVTLRVMEISTYTYLLKKVKFPQKINAGNFSLVNRSWYAYAVHLELCTYNLFQRIHIDQAFPTMVSVFTRLYTFVRYRCVNYFYSQNIVRKKKCAKIRMLEN